MSMPDSGTVKTVCDLNISRADGKSASALEVRCAHLYEKARCLYGEYPRFSAELPAAFRQLLQRETDTPGGELRELLRRQSEAQESFDCAFAARNLRGMYESAEPSVSADYTGTAPLEAPSSIAYLKNALADAAYRMFEQVLNDASVVYAADFNSVCEAVYDEKAGYCILPIESSADGRLAGFYGLIDKYELKIVSSCRVLSLGGTGATTFVLCGKAPMLISPDDPVRRVEIQIYHENRAFYRLLEICAVYGLQVLKCETLPSPDGNLDSLLLEGGDAQICDLLYCLFLTGARYTLLGIYNYINKEKD